MAAARQPLPGISWFDVDDPASPALDDLAASFSLHPLQIEDCRHGRQRAKTEEHDTYIFSVLKLLRPEKKQLFVDFDVFLGSGFLVTVHNGQCGVIEKVCKRIADMPPGDPRPQRLDWLFYMITDTIVDEYLPLLDEIAEATVSIEHEVLRHPEPPVLRRIFEHKRKLIDFRRVTGNMREVANAIMRRQGGFVGDDLDPYFRDVYDHLVRVLDLIESYRDILTGTLDIYLSAVANRTKEVMKVLTLYGTIAIPLVVITGFFGMNLHLPWAGEPRGALYAVGVMAVSVLVVLAYLNRKRWF
ncbi:MAG: magnesium transporter CorA family protein [Terriglobales bacterium]